MLMKILNKLSGNAFVNNETEFLPAVVEVVETPPSPVGRLVLWTLFILVVIGGIWSFVGTTDEVALATGKIIPKGFVKVVQAEDKGIVKNIYVTEGQTVKKGDLLIQLDQTISGADLARIKKQVAYYNLEIERLLSEQQGVPFAGTASADSDPRDLEFQLGLNRSRMAEYQTKIATAEANLRQNEATLAIAQVNKEKFSSQLEVAVEKETRIESLVADNAIAYFTLLDARSSRVGLAQSLAAQESEIARSQSAITQMRETLAGVRTERGRDIATSLVTDRKELMVYVEELKKVEDKARLSQIVSPADGRVNQLAVHTVGGIVTAAQAIMIIVPDDTVMEVEAYISNKDIGFVKVGQMAEIKVEAFSFQKFGILDAEIIEISPDALESSSDKDKDKNHGYRATLRLNKDHILVGNEQVYLSPGMAVTAEVKIRKKKIIEFFLDPFRQYQKEALRER